MQTMIRKKLLMLIVSGCFVLACFGQNSPGPAATNLPNPQRWPSVACTAEGIWRGCDRLTGAGGQSTTSWPGRSTRPTTP